MNDIILNDRYKYSYDKRLKRYRINIDNQPSPLYPRKLFKFHSPSLNSIAALHENYLWVSNPKDFNDPFDCNINLVEYKDLDTNQFKQSQSRNDLKNVGVTCFTEVVDEPLLWAHYAVNYTGFAIEFNSKTFRVNIGDTKRKHSLNPVLYFEKFIKIQNTDSFALEYLLSAKSIGWQYEKEWRLLLQLDPSNKYDRIIFYEPIAIKALYIGHRMLDDHETIFNLIESIFTRKYPKKPIYLVHPHPSKLALCFTKRPHISNSTT